MIGLARGTVELCEYHAEWKHRYEDERARLEAIAGEHINSIEHVGSTAIEGMPAKPVIDMLATVDEPESADALRPLLEENGYEYRPTDDVAGRLFFAKGPQTNRTHYLSVTERESTVSEETLVFRDYMRTHPVAAAEYAALKRELAATYPADRESYTDAKSTFVAAVLECAMNGE
ncbi:GrpB family protein [Natronolimnobius baerhuensis]|uniref:GrpB family protein n=1 Tax=Natronolimnobius baerhuensis TaxID=253108 RepID=A0A202ECK1_9EURY|nr:GrpB family protein [Natronolimnobius baerhuensis]OVE85945.1 hypothetical protein B2G88_03810 [Natronolimnobius baerhuensis]